MITTLQIFESGIEKAKVEVEMNEFDIYLDIQWDTKKGLITALKDGKRQALKIKSGNPIVNLPAQGNYTTNALDNAEQPRLTYHYWYY